VRVLLAGLMLLASFSAKAEFSLAAFYDPNRQTGIFEHNWFKPLNDKWYAAGFNEFYYLPEEGFPQESWVWFGKTWIGYKVTGDVSLMLELEHGYNNAGMYSVSKPFKADEFRVLPKIGVGIKFK
jgi:hypothetical protein